MKHNFYLGIDVGGTKISMGLVTANGKIVDREKMATPKMASSQRIVQLITNSIENILTENDLKPQEIRGIGIGVPGLVDPATGAIIHTPNMNLGGTRLKERLSKIFKTKVAIGNDVNFGILGEKWLGAARNKHNVIGLFLGTGLGGGVIINDKLLEGTNGAAAEIGHMIVDSNGLRCNCGNRGCLESYVGRWAIERDIKSAIKMGHKSLVKKLTKNSVRSIKSKILFLSLKKKDPVVTKTMRDVATRLGVACVSLRHIFDPQTIVLGGGVIEACGEFLLPIIRKTVREDKFFASLKTCQIEISELGDDAVMLGAVAFVKACG